MNNAFTIYAQASTSPSYSDRRCGLSFSSCCFALSQNVTFANDSEKVEQLLICWSLNC